jgi:hypothetical protein
MIKLYPATSSDTSWNEEAVQEFELSLQRWLDETSAFFHPSLDGDISAPEPSDLFEAPWSFKRSVTLGSCADLSSAKVRLTTPSSQATTDCADDISFHHHANVPRVSPERVPPYGGQYTMRERFHIASAEMRTSSNSRGLVRSKDR